MPPDPGPCFPPAGPAHSYSDGYALNVPPTVSSDQLLLVPLGHTSVVGDRPLHVRGPLVYGRILGLGSLRLRTRDPASRRSAQLTQTRTATHSNVPPTVSRDQLLLVPLGHTSVVGDRPPHVRGPLVYGRILGLGSHAS